MGVAEHHQRIPASGAARISSDYVVRVVTRPVSIPLLVRHLVRALALANFRDSSALPELHAMLRPWRMPSPAAGVLRYRLKAGEYANPGTLVARAGDTEVRSPLPGDVRALLRRDGAPVAAGDELV